MYLAASAARSLTRMFQRAGSATLPPRATLIGPCLAGHFRSRRRDLAYRETSAPRAQRIFAGGLVRRAPTKGAPTLKRRVKKRLMWLTARDGQRLFCEGQYGTAYYRGDRSARLVDRLAIILMFKWIYSICLLKTKKLFIYLS